METTLNESEKKCRVKLGLAVEFESETLEEVTASITAFCAMMTEAGHALDLSEPFRAVINGERRSMRITAEGAEIL